MSANPRSPRSRVDIVVAVRDEEQSIPLFVDRVDALALPTKIDLQLLFVEDSSTDGTRDLLRDLAGSRSDVGYAFLRRGYGQGIAICHGMRLSSADAVVMMDVDGSHPPEAIVDLVSAFQNGADVAQCVRRTLPQRKLYRRFGASAFHAISRLAFGLDFSEQNVLFRLVSTDVAKMILSEPRYWRYLRFPFSSVSGRVERIHIDTVERSVGKSKYDLPRLVMLALDGILCSLSRRRLLLLATTLLAASVALLSAGWWPVAVFLAGVLLWLVRRFREARRADALSLLETTESCNLPHGAAS